MVRDDPLRAATRPAERRTARPRTRGAGRRGAWLLMRPAGNELARLQLVEALPQPVRFVVAEHGPDAAHEVGVPDTGREHRHLEAAEQDKRAVNLTPRVLGAFAHRAVPSS